MSKNCLECKRYSPGAYGDSLCPFTKYVSYYGDFRQTFPHCDRWKISEDSCTRFAPRNPDMLKKKRKTRHRVKKYLMPSVEKESLVPPVEERDSVVPKA